MSESPRDDNEPASKRLKAASAKEDLPNTSPTTVVTWNANGLVSRCLYNQPELQQLILETEFPDVICLQEVRLKAMDAANRGKPLASEYSSVKEVLESTVFRDYRQFWSLADTRYAGTLTLMHKRLSIPSQHFAAFTVRSALSLLLKKFCVTRSDIGLPNESREEPTKKGASTKKQSSINAFFSRKAAPANKSTRLFAPEHHTEGRFQFFCFPDCDLIQTYVPNNGTNEESFQRRRNWDKDMQEFLERRRRILEETKQFDRPLLWCGDMNVAKNHRDGTHWEERHVTSEDGKTTIATFYEWWTDEKQCFAGSQAKKLDPNRSPADRGIPGFTTNERRRFAEVLATADLSDIWRETHPDYGDNETSVQSSNKYKSKWDRPLWTWRGHPAKFGNPYAGKYQGKGQRLDYFLLSPSSLTSKAVEKCEILGYGEMREGLFCGSDHCASILQLKSPLGRGDV